MSRKESPWSLLAVNKTEMTERRMFKSTEVEVARRGKQARYSSVARVFGRSLRRELGGTLEEGAAPKQVLQRRDL